MHGCTSTLTEAEGDSQIQAHRHTNEGVPYPLLAQLRAPGSPVSAASLAKQWADANRPFTTSLHCPRPLYMPASSLDPSLALGFLCRSPSDLTQLCVLLRGVFDTHGVQLFDVSEGGGDSGRSFSGGSEEGLPVVGAPGRVPDASDSGGAGGAGAGATAGGSAGDATVGCGGPQGSDASEDEFVLL